MTRYAVAEALFENYEIAGGQVVPVIVVNECDVCGQHFITDWQWEQVKGK